MQFLPPRQRAIGREHEREAVYALEARIEPAVAGIGCEHDGHEFGGSSGEARDSIGAPHGQVLVETGTNCT